MLGKLYNLKGMGPSKMVQACMLLEVRSMCVTTTILVGLLALVQFLRLFRVFWREMWYGKLLCTLITVVESLTFFHRVNMPLKRRDGRQGSEQPDDAHC